MYYSIVWMLPEIYLAKNETMVNIVTIKKHL